MSLQFAGTRLWQEGHDGLDMLTNELSVYGSWRVAQVADQKVDGWTYVRNAATGQSKTFG
jgi:hypothetical protein